jgi:hypothetical protein
MALARVVALAMALARARVVALALAMALARVVALARAVAVALAVARAMVKPMNTTFALLKSNNFRRSLIQKMAKILGGIKKYGKDTPIPIAAILNFRGLSDAICALRAVLPECEADAKILARKFACRCVIETILPDGRRVWDLLADVAKTAVETAEAFADGKASEQDLENARIASCLYSNSGIPRQEEWATRSTDWAASSSIIQWGAWMASLESRRAAHPRSAKADHFKFFRQLLPGWKG